MKKICRVGVEVGSASWGNKCCENKRGWGSSQLEAIIDRFMHFWGQILYSSFFYPFENNPLRPKTKKPTH